MRSKTCRFQQIFKYRNSGVVTPVQYYNSMLKHNVCVFNNIEVKSNQPVTKYWNGLHFQGQVEKWKKKTRNPVEILKDQIQLISLRLNIQVTDVLGTSELKFGEHLEALLTYPAQNIYLELGENTLSEEFSLFDLGIRRFSITFC